MSKKTILAAGTSPFAHLIAGAAALGHSGRAARGEEEDPKDHDAEEDEDTDPDAEDLPEDQPENGKRGKKGKRAEDDETDPDAEDEEVDPDDDASAAAEKRGYARAMKRCRAIFTSPASAGRPDLAAYFAFETDLDTKAAIGAMKVSANAPTGGGRRSLDDRMGSRSDARPGADTGSGSGNGSRGGTKLADRMVAVGKRLGQMG